MSLSSQTEDLPLIEGFLAGTVAWVISYVLTGLIVLAQIEDTDLSRISANVEDGSSIEFIGWVFFNSHFVDTVLEAGFLDLGSSSSVSFIGGDGFTPLLYVVPVALLIGAGLAIGRSQGVTETTDGAIAGLLVVPAYLVLSALGAVLFRVSSEALGANFSGQPDLLPAILLAGIVFPAIFGVLGGIIAASTS